MLREISDVESSYDEDELIGIHCLLSFPKVVKYRSSQTIHKDDLSKVVWETILTKAKPYRKDTMSITDLDEVRNENDPEAPEKSSQTGIKRPRLYSREDTMEIVKDRIPIRPGTTKYKIWSYLQSGITVAEFIAAIREAGLPGSAKDVQLAEKAGYIQVNKQG